MSLFKKKNKNADNFYEKSSKAVTRDVLKDEKETTLTPAKGGSTVIQKLGHPFKHAGYLVLGTASTGLALVSVSGPILFFGLQVLTLPLNMWTDKVFSMNAGGMYGATKLTKGICKGTANFFKKAALPCDSTAYLPSFADSIQEENPKGGAVKLYKEVYDYRSNFRIK